MAVIANAARGRGYNGQLKQNLVRRSFAGNEKLTAGVALAEQLRQAIRGDVRFDAGSRAIYATDASHYRELPIGVVVPRDAEDVLRALHVCRSFGAPILARGAGTSLNGQCCNVAVIFDFSRYMNNVLWVDPERRRARVEGGTILANLQRHAAAHGLTFGPDPATQRRCTLGGMIGNNACGVHSPLAGRQGHGTRTSDQLLSLKVLTYDGTIMEVGPTPPEALQRIVQRGGRRAEIYRQLCDLREQHHTILQRRYPHAPRRLAGYENLDWLLAEKGCNVAQALAGTESTCALVLEAELALLDNPRERVLLVLGYPDIFQAGAHVPLILEHRPDSLDGMDRLVINHRRRSTLETGTHDLLPAGDGFLLVEFSGDTREEAAHKAGRLLTALRRAAGRPEARLFSDDTSLSALWEMREATLDAAARPPNTPGTWPGWEMIALEPRYINPFLHDLRELYAHYDFGASLYGHFGQGLIHCRVTFDLHTIQGIDKYRYFLDEAIGLVLDYGGTLGSSDTSGRSQSALAARLYGDEMLAVFRQFKAIWDPQWKMNPGRIVEADPPAQALWQGTGYLPWEPESYAPYLPEDNSLAAPVSQLRP